MIKNKPKEIKMKKLILFDMDGTLTPPRKRAEYRILNSISKLQKAGFEIGIVTGSDMEYIEQQMELAFDLSPIDPFKVHYLPCNGTKYYRLTASHFKKIYGNDMRSHLGEKEWRRLIQLLTSLQSSIVRVYKDIPMTGTFINYRGSMINWCPIGRQADDKDRSEWALWDRKQNIRDNWLTIARQGLDNTNLENVVIKLGGDTSFDIYPEGWDKTYAFKQFEDYDKIYFIGDRCGPTGNDHEAFVLAGDNGYSTTDPDNTIEIIEKILKE